MKNEGREGRRVGQKGKKEEKEKKIDTCTANGMSPILMLEETVENFPQHEIQTPG